MATSKKKTKDSSQKPVTKKTAPAPKSVRQTAKKSSAKVSAGKGTATKTAAKQKASDKPAAPKEKTIAREKSRPAAPRKKQEKEKTISAKTAAVKTAPAEQPAKAAAKTKGDTISAIQAIAKASATAKTTKGKPGKKPVIAAFTLDDVRDVLKTRTSISSVEEKEQEAAERKTSVGTVMPEKKQPARVLGAATLADILGFGPKPAVKVVEKPMVRDVPEKFRKYHEQLLALRSRIQLKANNRGSIMADGNRKDPALPAQKTEDDNFDHNFALSLVANEQEALLEIDAALERIYEGTYGICEITGKEIAPERLEAVPFARFSVEGQAQFEMQNRRRSQRTTTFLDSSEDAGAFSGDDVDE